MSIIQRQSIVQHANIDISQSKWYILCYMHMCRQLPVASPRALRQTVTAFAIPSKTSVQFASPIIFYRPQIKPKKKKYDGRRRIPTRSKCGQFYSVCVFCAARRGQRESRQGSLDILICVLHTSAKVKKKKLYLNIAYVLLQVTLTTEELARVISDTKRDLEWVHY